MTKIFCVVNDEIQAGSGLMKDHGVSFWIKMEHTNVLFDTGPKPEVLSHNLKRLGL